ncbi:MAG: T9SS type A sorting domain-containing protein [Ignavibacteriaceae bacterium]|nr:T9SS type A sorting domain-containing protein [Ignavibacteriaceae bacterium]
MKTLNSFFVLMVLALFNFNISAQDLEVIYHETTIYEPPGTEIVFDIEIINISALEQTVFLVRTLNNLPAGLGWTSSLCFGELCFSPTQDSVATAPPNPEPPLQPGDTLEASVHVFTMNNIGTAYVQVQIGTFRNPGDRTTIDYTATTDLTVGVEDEFNLNSYELEQNYPNPFNPSTQINYNVGESGLVNLKVYNILGKEVTTLVNEYKPTGRHKVSFDGNDLSSGVYIYRLSVNEFTKTRKMILEK